MQAISLEDAAAQLKSISQNIGNAGSSKPDLNDPAMQELLNQLQGGYGYSHISSEPAIIGDLINGFIDKTKDTMDIWLPWRQYANICEATHEVPTLAGFMDVLDKLTDKTKNTLDIWLPWRDHQAKCKKNLCKFLTHIIFISCLFDII